MAPSSATPPSDVVDGTGQAAAIKANPSIGGLAEYLVGQLPDAESAGAPGEQQAPQGPAAVET